MPAIAEKDLSAGLVELIEHFHHEIEFFDQPASPVPHPAPKAGLSGEVARISHPVAQSNVEQSEGWRQLPDGIGAHIGGNGCAGDRHCGGEIETRIDSFHVGCRGDTFGDGTEQLRSLPTKSRVNMKKSALRPRRLASTDPCTFIAVLTMW